MSSRRMLMAFNRQVKQLPEDLLNRECALVELGRQHARNLDAGHSPSGAGVQKVLAELRKLSAGRKAPIVPESGKAGGIADLTARIAARRDATPG